LNRMLEGGQVTGVRVSVVDGDLSYAFE
jgi:hypothetical protein